ncbi:membrane protein [Filimonas zeae]|uniref:Membrane protein n=2 Tax=Filimonas zeae TaxID=1737353 RepID=A0A917IMT6_9BACT|nr:membrane protein [Filimonas zeae]
MPSVCSCVIYLILNNMTEPVSLFAKIVIGLVALEHLYILWMEMFAWETVGKKTFKSLPAHLFTPTKGLAANQGLYNGFLAAGLIWSLFISNAEWQQHIALFFLSCVAIAGVFGAVTAAKRIFWVQAMPALVGIAVLLWL